jgi:hypothetical protein
LAYESAAEEKALERVESPVYWLAAEKEFGRVARFALVWRWVTGWVWNWEWMIPR